jgi:molybdopterin-guanine dinucleotide biosynthesis protein A
VVLAGGAARRLGGVDKGALVVGGRTLLDTVLEACADAATTVVVGPRRQTQREVTWTQEAPAGGGPCAGLAAAVPLLSAPVTVLLATDLPWVRAPLVRTLVTAAPAVGVDRDGRAQWLLSAWPTALLRNLPASGSIGRALDPLGWTVVEAGDEAGDVDTPDELAAAQAATSTMPSTTRAANVATRTSGSSSA